MCPDKGLPTLVVLEVIVLLTLLTFSYIAPSNEDIYNMFFFMRHEYKIILSLNNILIHREGETEVDHRRDAG